MTTGEALKKNLGLSHLTFVKIQKVLDIGKPFFIITFDSRYPHRYLPYSRIKNIKSTTLLKVISSKPQTVLSEPKFKNQKVKITVPMDLEVYDRIISTGSILFLRDLSGEYYRNERMFEYTKNKKLRLI